VPLAVAVGDAEAVPVAVAVAEADAVAVAVDVGRGNLLNACWFTFVWPDCTAKKTPRVTPNATGMARGTAMRAARLR